MAFLRFRQSLIRYRMAMSRQLLVTRRKNQSDCREGGKSFWHYRDKD
jgi:hypothetical protein